MAQFRERRPPLVEAVQWTEDVSMATLIEFANGLVQLNDVERKFRVYDRTEDRWIPFEYGDWIVRGDRNEYFPCRPDCFAGTYEAVDAHAP